MEIWIMGKETKIAWADSTVNAWIGCAKVGPECLNCYAEAQEKRFGRAVWGVNTPRYKTITAEGSARKLNREAAEAGKRSRVFMSSESDFFDAHPDCVPWRKEWWDIVKECKNLDWLILSKRTQLIPSMVPPDFYSGEYRHVNLGGSVGVKASLSRLDDLRAVPDWGGLRFVSAEPLLEPLGTINLSKIDWIIVGGESTPSNRFRPMQEDWVQEIKDQAEAQGTVFFFKQDAARQGKHSHEFQGKQHYNLPMFNG
jgi:protein gp37